MLSWFANSCLDEHHWYLWSVLRQRVMILKMVPPFAKDNIVWDINRPWIVQDWVLSLMFQIDTNVHSEDSSECVCQKFDQSLWSLLYSIPRCNYLLWKFTNLYTIERWRESTYTLWKYSTHQDSGGRCLPYSQVPLLHTYIVC